MLQYPNNNHNHNKPVNPALKATKPKQWNTAAIIQRGF